MTDRRTIRAELRMLDGTVRRVRIPEGTPFVWDVWGGHYYDLVKGAQYRERVIQDGDGSVRPMPQETTETKGKPR